MTRGFQPASLGRCPLSFVFLGAVGGIFVASRELWGVAVVAIVLGIFWGLYYRKPAIVVAAVVGLLMACLHHDRLQRQGELVALLASNSQLRLRGVLVESNEGGMVRRRFRTESGAQLSLLGLGSEYRTGQKLSILGVPVIDEEKRNPAGWEAQKALRRRGIAGILEVTSAQVNGWSLGLPRWRGWSERLRYDLGQRLTAGIEDHQASELVRGVSLGDKDSGSETFEDFRKTGTLHIFAVSGLHVGLVALILFWVGKALRLPPRLLIGCTIFAMFGYAFLTGLRPPALRASLMGAIFLARFLLLRRASVFNNLFAAAIIVVAFDSFQLARAGFQLSFCVVAIILILEPILWGKLAPFADHDSFLPRPLWTRLQRLSYAIKSKVGRMLTVSFSAWCGSAPLSFLYFGWFTPISTLASVWMVTIAFLILACSCLSLVLGSLVPVSRERLNVLNGGIARMAIGSAEKFSQVPGAWREVRPASPWQGGLCVFDLRYGGSGVHLDAGGGTLIDAGGEAAYFSQIGPALRAHGLTCDSLVATHGDSVHVNGLALALQAYPIKQALFPIGPYRNSLDELREAVDEKEVALRVARVGQFFSIDEDTRIEVLFAGHSSMPRADDRGLVLRIWQRGWRILMTADAGYETERALLASGQDLGADVWICGRNAQDSMGQDHFVEAVSPLVVIATESAYPAEEQIPLTWRRWLERKGVHFFSQKEHGAVFVVPDKDKLTVSSYLQKGKTTLIR